MPILSKMSFNFVFMVLFKMTHSCKITYITCNLFTEVPFSSDELLQVGMSRKTWYYIVFWTNVLLTLLEELWENTARILAKVQRTFPGIWVVAFWVKCQQHFQNDTLQMSDLNKMQHNETERGRWSWRLITETEMFIAGSLCESHSITLLWIISS